MESKPNNPPLIVIVGETASGKTSLSLQLAQRFSGEIIAADSRTVYTGMDIGTAKPAASELAQVPHHLLDITTPDQPITAAQYKLRAQEAIADIVRRGNVPFLVGGTGLYIDAVLYDFAFRTPANPAEREKLQQLSIEELQTLLQQAGIPLPNNARNPRHLIRQLETKGEQAAPAELRANTLVLGMQVDRALLKERIATRVDVMLQAGLEAEVVSLSKKYGWDIPPMQTIGYQEFRAYFAGNATLEEVKQEIVRNTVRYAKRQRSWFKRNPSIQHICNVDEAVDLITTFLNK
jgi:tRNA dimethylallyltransferase